MARLLVSAEPYGYGPSAKLRAVSAELIRRGHDIDFIGQGVAAQYAQGEPDTYARVRTVQSMRELAAVPGTGYDAAISVMDPHLAIWAQLSGIPCIYVDSLYWFWKWDEDFSAITEEWEKVRSSGNVDEGMAFFDTVPMMSAQYLAHAAAQVTCAQRTPATPERAIDFSQLGSVRVVNAIVDTTFAECREPTTWLACMSGLINPLTPTEYALSWLRSSAQLIDEAAREAGLADAEIQLTGNHDVISLAMTSLPARFVSRPMSNGAVLKEFNSGYACMTPPGLTTMFEAIAYGIPLIILPEQHYAHSQIFEEFSHGGPDAFRHGLLGPRLSRQSGHDAGADTVGIIGELAERAAERDKVWHSMVADVAAGMSAVRTDKKRVALGQLAAVRGFVGNFDGARQVADVVKEFVGA
jgi:hypothetical protein